MNAHERYAVRTVDGWLGNSKGHDWRTGKPGYERVTAFSRARLFIRKADATKAAAATLGSVFTAKVDLG